MSKTTKKYHAFAEYVLTPAELGIEKEFTVASVTEKLLRLLESGLATDGDGLGYFHIFEDADDDQGEGVHWDGGGLCFKVWEVNSVAVVRIYTRAALVEVHNAMTPPLLEDCKGKEADDWGKVVKLPEGCLPAVESPKRYLTRESKGIEVYTETGVREQMFHHDKPGGYHKAGWAWKLDVGAECNLALEAARQLSERPAIGDNPAMAAALRSLVARVAAFEELDTED